MTPLLTLVATLIAVDGWLSSRRGRDRSPRTVVQDPVPQYCAPPQSPVHPSYAQSPAPGVYVPPAPSYRSPVGGAVPWIVALVHVPVLFIGWWHVVGWESILAEYTGRVPAETVDAMPVSAFFFVLCAALICLRLARTGDPASGEFRRRSTWGS
ncbi:hypothetical protein [Sphaerisporangium aureirubrum]|uniref:Uncharacterized protein n=1 Tax=Sphaerisporangium aureirubrum TaxID=1544736 RepID=A0ABW1NM64_9ACTN